VSTFTGPQVSKPDRFFVVVASPRGVAGERGFVSSKVIMGLKCAFHLRLGLRLDYNIWMGTSVRLSKYTEGLGWVFK